MDSSEKNSIKSTSRGTFLYVLGLFFICLGVAFIVVGDTEILPLAILTAALGYILSFQGDRINRKIRAEKYTDILLHSYVASIEDISKKISIPSKVIRKDIQRLINKGELKNTYIDLLNNKVIMGKENIARYKAGTMSNEESEPEEIPASKTHCLNCGAPLYEKDSICKYCDTVIK